MSNLRLELLGKPQVFCNDIPLMDWTLQKSLAMLTYLAVTGRTYSRGALADLLWPTRSEDNARSNLRKILSELHHRLPSHLTITRAEAGFDRASTYWLDVEVFEQDVGRVLALPEGHINRGDAAILTEAVELYRGDFVLGLVVHNSPVFEEWVLLEREYLRNLALQAFHVLVDYHSTQAQSGKAFAYLDRMLALEPAHEEAHRHKMTLLALNGQRTAALRQYAVCRQALMALDAEPDWETMALYERVLTGTEWPVRSRFHGHNLNTPLTPLVGREVELAEIRALLQDPACRLLILVGPGGIGKTHMALQAAADILSGDMRFASPLDSFEDGVCIVRLESIPGKEAIAPAIAQAMDLPLSEGTHPLQQVVDHLRSKNMLLVMDGFEHLLVDASLLVELLHAALDLKILVTSRVKLDVEGEYLLPIQGLVCPESVPGDSERLDSFPAIRLFVSTARRMKPGFQATATELEEVARICHLVGGWPLAILLAAGWVRMLSLTEITAELEGQGSRGLDFLQTDRQDLSIGQRSIRAVFDRSWDLLPPREQQVLAGLSVFRSSFTLAAACQVACASLWDLRTLMDRSLLQHAAGGRYAMHKLLRQYASEKFALTPEADQVARDRHSGFYAAALERWWVDLQGPEPSVVLANIGVENQNLRTAWEWMVEYGQVAQLDQAMNGLCYSYKWRGQYEQGESFCRRVVEGLTITKNPHGADAFDIEEGVIAATLMERECVLARALSWWGVFCHRMGRHEEAWRLLQRSLDRLDDLAIASLDPEEVPEAIQHGRAFTLWRLGNLSAEMDHKDAQPFYRQSLALYKGLDDSWGTASVLAVMNRTTSSSGERNRVDGLNTQPQI